MVRQHRGGGGAKGSGRLLGSLTKAGRGQGDRRGGAGQCEHGGTRRTCVDLGWLRSMHMSVALADAYNTLLYQWYCSGVAGTCSVARRPVSVGAAGVCTGGGEAGASFLPLAALAAPPAAP